MCVYAPESQQLNVQADVQVGLQLLGLSLVALSTTLPEASALACCSLVAWHLLPTRARSPALPAAAEAGGPW